MHSKCSPGLDAGTAALTFYWPRLCEYLFRIIKSSSSSLDVQIECEELLSSLDESDERGSRLFGEEAQAREVDS